MELEIAGQKYQTGKLNAFQQFHVTRRLMPVLVAQMKGLEALAQIIGAKMPSEPETTAEKEAEARGAPPAAFQEAIAEALSPIAEALAKMPEADADYVLKVCLGVCKRRSGDGWAAVQSSSGTLNFEDLTMDGMIKLVMGVVRENLGDFFPFLQGTGQ